MLDKTSSKSKSLFNTIRYNHEPSGDMELEKFAVVFGRCYRFVGIGNRFR